jgi:DNA-binding transcriptional regulator PaaX
MLQHVNSDRRLTPAACRVAFWLTHHLDRETHMCWPSIGRLMRLTGLSDKAVRLAIQNLEAAGYIEVDRTRGQHNVYTALEREKWDMKRFMKRDAGAGKKYRTPPGKKYR